MRDWLAGWLDLLLPRACGGCRRASRDSHALCARCDAVLPRLPRDTCVLCGGARGDAARCGACAAHDTPLEACVAAVAFAGPVERWVHAFKYPAAGLLGLDPGPAAVLTALLLEAAGRAPGPPPQALVPVPLAPARLRGRGFNPAAELAAGLARARGLRHAPALLERVRDTPSQTGLGAAARRRNVAGAFRVRRGAHVPARVWLIDDVTTTGATLSEAARALRRGGARSVVGVCVARTPPPR